MLDKLFQILLEIHVSLFEVRATNIIDDGKKLSLATGATSSIAFTSTQENGVAYEPGSLRS